MAAVQKDTPSTSEPTEAVDFPISETHSTIDGTDQRVSKKREREVSLEPSTPKPDVDDDAVTTAPSSGRRSPKKKNRTRLDSTQEEDAGTSRSRSKSRSPERPSPPHEVKVRQISQGVEDMNWRQKKMADDAAAAAENTGETPGPSDILVVDEEAATPASVDEVLQDIIPEDLDVERNDSSQSRRSSGSDGGDEGNALKRKLAQRATSHGLENVDTQQNGTSESSKRVKDDGDDNPRAKKRPTPPRTPEAATPEDSCKRPTPPVTPPPSSSHDVSLTSPEPLKRPREDADKDDNPRQTKKPSPPPEKKESAPAAVTPKLGGFMAYASTSSPFASVKGQNIFGGGPKTSMFSKSPSPSPAAFTSSFNKASTPVLGDSSSSASTATKRSGFEAFAGSTSPFASAARAKSPNALGSGSALRSKSPGRRSSTSKNSTAFTSYATGGAQAFAVPMPKRTRTGSPEGGLERSGSVLSTSGARTDEEDEDSGKHDGQLSFGEKLRAGKDSEDVTDDEVAKPEFTSQEVTTGEEGEKCMYMVRAKLFYLDQNQWRERGTGTLKLNVRLSDGEGPRLVMRKEAVFNLLLNVPIFPGMSVSTAQDPRYVRLSAFEEGQTVHYNLRVATAKMGEELLDAIKTYAAA